MATTVAVLLALWVGALTASATGADAITVFGLLTTSIVAIALLVGAVGGISWWVLKRRGALGPSLLWGADGPTRRGVTAGLRGQRRLDGVDQELALSEAERPWGCIQGVIALRRAHRYLARYTDVEPSASGGSSAPLSFAGFPGSPATP